MCLKWLVLSESRVLSFWVCNQWAVVVVLWSYWKCVCFRTLEGSLNHFVPESRCLRKAHLPYLHDPSILVQFLCGVLLLLVLLSSFACAFYGCWTWKGWSMSLIDSWINHNLKRRLSIDKMLNVEGYVSARNNGHWDFEMQVKQVFSTNLSWSLSSRVAMSDP